MMLISVEAIQEVVNFGVILESYEMNQTNKLKDKRASAVHEGVVRVNTNIQKAEMAWENVYSFADSMKMGMRGN